MTRRKRAMPRVSSRRKAEMVVYGRDRRFFLILHPLCEACPRTGNLMHLSCDIHHTCGRTGKNYLDQSTWLAVCRRCHSWIHENKSKARALGLLK